MSSSSKRHAIFVVVALVLLAIVAFLVSDGLKKSGNQEVETQDPELEAMIQELERQAGELEKRIGN